MVDPPLWWGPGSVPGWEPGCACMHVQPGKGKCWSLVAEGEMKKRVLQLLAARPSYCNWTHRKSAQNQFLAAGTHSHPPPIPLHRAALLEGACSLTSPMRHLSCRHIVAASSASLCSIYTWTRSRHNEATLSIAMQSAPKSTAEVLSDCRSRGHLWATGFREMYLSWY